MRFITPKVTTVQVFNKEAFNTAISNVFDKTGMVPVKVVLNDEDYEAAMKVFSRPQIKFATRNYLRPRFPTHLDDFSCDFDNKVHDIVFERKSCGEPEFVFRALASSF